MLSLLPMTMDMFLTLPRYHWLLVSIVVFTLTTIIFRYQQKIFALLIIAISTTILIALTPLFMVSTYASVAFLFFVTFGLTYAGQQYPRYYLATFMMNLLVLVRSVTPVDTMTTITQSLLMLIALALMLLVQLIFILATKNQIVIREENIVLQQLGKLTKEIFNCFLMTEYNDNLYLFERRLHVAKNNYLQAIADFEFNVPNKHKILAQSFELVYLALMNCTQLRRRVSDFTVFSLCKDELIVIANAILDYLAALQHCHTEVSTCNTDKLAYALQRFEENYVAVLQVTAREPLVFHLFIANIKSLISDLNALCENLCIEEAVHAPI